MERERYKMTKKIMLYILIAIMAGTMALTEGNKVSACPADSKANEVEKMTSRELLQEAQQARKGAYTPYAHFQVGAALETGDGKIYRGCNIENAAYGATSCAERTAFFRAVAAGERSFTRIAIAGGPEGQDAAATCGPCGICRQVMREFCDPEKFIIIMADGRGGVLEKKLAELLPLSFGPDNLRE